MSHGFILFVTSGVHTGATVMFGPVNKLTIGSAASSDLMLVDERSSRPTSNSPSPARRSRSRRCTTA